MFWNFDTVEENKQNKNHTEIVHICLLQVCCHICERDIDTFYMPIHVQQLFLDFLKPILLLFFVLFKKNLNDLYQKRDVSL